MVLAVRTVRASQPADRLRRRWGHGGLSVEVEQILLAEAVGTTETVVGIAPILHGPTGTWTPSSLRATGQSLTVGESQKARGSMVDEPGGVVGWGWRAR